MAVAVVLIPSSLAMVHLMFAQALSPLFLVLGFIDLTTLPLFLRSLYCGVGVQAPAPGALETDGVYPGGRRDPSGGALFLHSMPHRFHSFGDALLPSYLLVYGILLLTILFDWRKGRLLWPFPFTLIYYAVIQLTMVAGGHSSGFFHIASDLARLRAAD